MGVARSGFKKMTSLARADCTAAAATAAWLKAASSCTTELKIDLSV